MDKKFLHTLVIIGCTAFWLGSMIYSFVEEPWLYFKPLAVMIMLLLLLAKHYAIKQGAFIYAFTWFFFILSVSNVLKELLFDPLKVMGNDFVFAGVALVIAIFKFIKHRKALEKLSARAR